MPREGGGSWGLCPRVARGGSCHSLYGIVFSSPVLPRPVGSSVPPCVPPLWAPILWIFFKENSAGSLRRGVLGILARGGRNFPYFWEVREVLDIVFEVGGFLIFLRCGDPLRGKGNLRYWCEVDEILDFV